MGVLLKSLLSSSYTPRYQASWITFQELKFNLTLNLISFSRQPLLSHHPGLNPWLLFAPAPLLISHRFQFINIYQPPAKYIPLCKFLKKTKMNKTAHHKIRYTKYNFFQRRRKEGRGREKRSISWDIHRKGAMVGSFMVPSIWPLLSTAHFPQPTTEFRPS